MMKIPRNRTTNGKTKMMIPMKTKMKTRTKTKTKMNMNMKTKMGMKVKTKMKTKLHNGNKTHEALLWTLLSDRKGLQVRKMSLNNSWT